MTLPFRIGPTLPREAFAQVRRRAVLECFKWDPQHADHCVLASFPVLLRQSAWRELCRLAEDLCRETLAAERELAHRPELHRELGLPRPIRKALRAHEANGTPGAGRVMRFDFHFTAQGWRVSEVNSDVPGGFVEAGGFTRLMAEFFPGLQVPEDPARAYAARLRAACGDGAVVAFVHATAHCDDRQVMQYIARECGALGIRSVMASPMHIEWRAGSAQIVCAFYRGRPEALVRFFPGEWLPNLRQADRWQPWFRGSHTLMSNPGTALLVQSKRFPLVWDRLRTPLPTWRRLLPPTCSPLWLTSRQLAALVLKPALGRVGEDVVVPGATAAKLAARCRRSARWFPSWWVAQEPFDALAAGDNGARLYPCFGVFCIDGKAAGIYARVATRPLIDEDAQDVAVLIEPEENEC